MAPAVIFCRAVWVLNGCHLLLHLWPVLLEKLKIQTSCKRVFSTHTFWRKIKTNPSSNRSDSDWRKQDWKGTLDLLLNSVWPTSMSAFRRSRNSKRSTESVYDMLQLVSRAVCRMYICVCVCVCDCVYCGYMVLQRSAIIWWWQQR